MTELVFDDLESQSWTKQSGPNINAVVPDAMEVTNNADGSLRFSIAASQAEAGGLISLDLPFIPSIGPSLQMAYFALDFEAYLSLYDAAQIAQFEADLKIAVMSAPSGISIANVVDGSAQLNLVQGGAWEIDQPVAGNAVPQWTPTGFKPGPITPETWTPIATRGMINVTKGTYSMLSIAQGTAPAAAVPAAMQNVPLLVTNWQQGIAVQLQAEILLPGELSINYRKIKVRLRDQPF